MAQKQMQCMLHLYYIHDPMCSWCWGYKPTLKLLKQQLPASIEFNYVVGGLAPDSDEPMSDEMKQKLQAIWKQIEAKLGTEFNHEFWTECTLLRAACPATGTFDIQACSHAGRGNPDARDQSPQGLAASES